jgi:hypothetical protein
MLFLLTKGRYMYVGSFHVPQRSSSRKTGRERRCIRWNGYRLDGMTGTNGRKAQMRLILRGRCDGVRCILSCFRHGTSGCMHLMVVITRCRVFCCDGRSGR